MNKLNYKVSSNFWKIDGKFYQKSSNKFIKLEKCDARKYYFLIKLSSKLIYLCIVFTQI